MSIDTKLYKKKIEEKSESISECKAGNINSSPKAIVTTLEPTTYVSIHYNCYITQKRCT